MSFRVALANEIGLDLKAMRGFGDFAEDGKPWDGLTDPICLLLNHSDCDGELTPEESKRVAPRLRELVADWPDDRDKLNALTLADDMERFAEKGLPLIFT